LMEHGIGSGSFFPQLRVFNNFSASFFGSFRFVFANFSVFSITSPVRSLKKVLFFIFFSLESAERRPDFVPCDSPERGRFGMPLVP
jgi:hypothetical protein